MSELKRCPFCGSEAKIRIDHYPRTVYSVECSNEDCFIGQLGIYRKKEDAIKVWNTRKPMDRIVERLEAIQDNLPAELSHCHEFYVEGMFEGLNRGIEIVKKKLE